MASMARPGLRSKAGVWNSILASYLDVWGQVLGPFSVAFLSTLAKHSYKIPALHTVAQLSMPQCRLPNTSRANSVISMIGLFIKKVFLFCFLPFFFKSQKEILPYLKQIEWAHSGSFPNGNTSVIALVVASL